ncbi:MAG: type II secretion system protein [Desulfobacterales bacterium]|nr:MAG: type II secretion system protein [Desulfobacterales bacterium]
MEINPEQIVNDRNNLGEHFRRHNARGLTLLEIVVVFLLISIISAVVLGRSINTQEIDLASQYDKVRNHIRYAQSMAMKRPDKIVWGISCRTGPPNEYWLFYGTDPTDQNNQEALPGEAQIRIALADNNVSMGAFTVYFDQYGRPYDSYTDENDNNALTSPMTIILSAGGDSRSLSITPETGYIQ